MTVNPIIPTGTAPEDVVGDMELIHQKESHKTNARTVHWGAVPRSKIPLSVKSGLQADPTVLAIWQDREKLVIAWVDLREIPVARGAA